MASKAWNDLAAAFELRHRDNGQPFYALAVGSPEWMVDAVREAHGEAMPNDWAYKLCAYIAQAAAEYDEPEEYACEIADSVVPVYTYDLIDWLASSVARQCLADEAIEGGAKTIAGACQWGCYSEAESIFWALHRAVEAASAEAYEGD